MYDSLDKVLEYFKDGKFVIVFDEDREVEGDFFLLAENISPEKVNFLFEYGKGMICVACSAEILDDLKIKLMVEDNKNPHGTNFCLSVDAKKNVTTGVSAGDRAEVIRLLASEKSTFNDFVIPGHTFPLRAEQDLNKRFGHTESSVELAKKVAKREVVVICEILNKVGEKANLEELTRISQDFDIPMTSLNNVREFLK